MPRGANDSPGLDLNLGACLPSCHGPSPWPGPEELGISLNEHSGGLEEGPQRAGGVLRGTVCPFRGITGSTRGQHTRSPAGGAGPGEVGSGGRDSETEGSEVGPSHPCHSLLPTGL